MDSKPNTGNIHYIDRLRAIVADIEGTNKEDLDSFIAAIESNVGELGEEDYSIEVMGSSLGASFFKETIIALISILPLGDARYTHSPSSMPSSAAVCG